MGVGFELRSRGYLLDRAQDKSTNFSHGKLSSCRLSSRFSFLVPVEPYTEEEDIPHRKFSASR